MLGLFGGMIAGSGLELGLGWREGKKRLGEAARGETRCGLIVLVGGLRVCLGEGD